MDSKANNRCSRSPWWLPAAQIVICGSFFLLFTAQLLGVGCRNGTAVGDIMPGRACSIHVRYVPSAYERMWLDNVKGMPDDLCAAVAAEEGVFGKGAQSRGMESWLAALKHDYELPSPSTGQMDPTVFSRFITSSNCSWQHKFGRKTVGLDRTVSELTTWIEPLAYGLRHPQAHCPNSNVSIFDKTYLLLAHQGDVPLSYCQGRKCQNIFIDLGASTWDEKTDHTAGQPWFFNSYSHRGIHFDRLLLWEAAPADPAKVFRYVPKDILHKYQYFNTPATGDRLDPSNPVNIMKSIAQPGDFVVFKLVRTEPLFPSSWQRVTDTLQLLSIQHMCQHSNCLDWSTCGRILLLRPNTVILMSPGMTVCLSVSAKHAAG
eukprot:GHUV01011336.1.p1 GENE.GHUV01011336.1~~GHUV01011336.1.p1  ORF type:complete len:374 (+),score=32.52 GHUV01011336.1:1639-2760(+)